MKRLLLLVALLSPLLMAQTAQKVVNRGLNQDLSLCVNTSGVIGCPVTLTGTTSVLTLGPTGGAVVHNMLGALSFGAGSNTGTPTYGLRRNGSNALEFFTNSTSVGTTDSSGNWTLGPSAGANTTTKLGGGMLFDSSFASVTNTSSFFSTQGGVIIIVNKTTPGTCMFTCALITGGASGSCVVTADTNTQCSATFGAASKISCGFSASLIRCANNLGSTLTLHSINIGSQLY